MASPPDGIYHHYVYLGQACTKTVNTHNANPKATRFTLGATRLKAAHKKHTNDNTKQTSTNNDTTHLLGD